jgi:hypothetical protein
VLRLRTHKRSVSRSGTLTFYWSDAALTRLLTSMLYEVAPTDPSTFAMVAALLGGAAFVAGCVPAQRAARVDPISPYAALSAVFALDPC